ENECGGIFHANTTDRTVLMRWWVYRHLETQLKFSGFVSRRRCRIIGVRPSTDCLQRLGLARDLSFLEAPDMPTQEVRLAVTAHIPNQCCRREPRWLAMLPRRPKRPARG